MDDVVVEVKDLSKKYRLGEIKRHDTLRDALSEIGRNFRGSLEKDEFWALKDVNFSIKQGEVFGIIGKNGSGKSTLLKILSRITPPTTGEALLKGRVASLLEVGTGFSPELTGRENIFLNGSILGMTQKEIKRKFDEIVAFSEVEKFLDTPVKRYSSGMYTRLAFSVAAFLESEILLVDEVLSVGDARFQERSLGKMEEVTRKEGRTILFVSHNMGAVASLCSRCLLLAEGKNVAIGNTNEIIQKYLSGSVVAKSGVVVLSKKSRLPAYVHKIWFENNSRKIVSHVEMGEDIYICIEYVVNKSASGADVGVLISRDGIPMLYSLDIDTNLALTKKRSVGTYKAEVKIPAALFKEGEYLASIMMSWGGNISTPDAVTKFTVRNNSRDLTHKSYRSDRPGFLFQNIPWLVEKLK